MSEFDWDEWDEFSREFDAAFCDVTQAFQLWKTAVEDTRVCLSSVLYTLAAALNNWTSDGTADKARAGGRTEA